MWRDCGTMYNSVPRSEIDPASSSSFFSRLLASKHLAITLCVGLPLLGGSFGALFTKNQIKAWYSTLKKPSWTPPNYVFGPIWTSLYIAMGYASYRVLSKVNKAPGAEFSLKLYAVKLLLNFAWTPLFFGAHEVGWSVINILALLGMTIWTGLEFYKVDKIAGYLFIPYVSWVSIATALNISIYLLNPK